MTATPRSCEAITRQYIEALSGDLKVEPYGRGCIITTPFMRADGDFVELMAELGQSGTIRLTDMGESLAFLHLHGLSLSKRILGDVRRISGRYGVNLNINELVVEVDEAADSNPLHALIQAVTSVSDLVEKRRPRTRILFDETVEGEIIARGRAYDTNIPIQGLRQRHVVGFHINNGAHLLAQPFSPANENSARATIERWFYKFSDILEKDDSWDCYAVLDDRGGRERVWTNDAQRPLAGLVKLVAWSRKEEFLEAIGPRAY